VEVTPLPNTTAALFKIGDKVSWTSQSRGYSASKIGFVAAVIPSGGMPDPTEFPSLYKGLGVGGYRNHVSYVVRVSHGPGRQDSVYWPLAKKLVAVHPPIAEKAKELNSLRQTMEVFEDLFPGEGGTLFDRMVAVKRIADTVETSKQCHVCGKETPFGCADCGIDFGVVIRVCATASCRAAHEEKCPQRLLEKLQAITDTRTSTPTPHIAGDVAAVVGETFPQLPITSVHRLRDGEPCKHTGCLQHLTHPCEGCGRIGGRRTLDQLRRDVASIFPGSVGILNDETASISCFDVIVGRGNCIMNALRSAANVADHIMEMQGGSTTPGFALQYLMLHPELVKTEE
jgi:hypothetical protein